jgi:hypothetical protein
MSALTSPYNSPLAQQKRLREERETYFRKRGTLRDTAGTIFTETLVVWVAALIATSFSSTAALVIFGGGVLLIIYMVGNFFHVSSSFPEGRFKCPHCEARTSIYRPWVCGYCETSHQPQQQFPTPSTWVEPCSKCNLLPHSLACPACGKLIVFDEVRLALSPKEFAWIVGRRPSKEPVLPSFDDRPPERFTEHLR